MKPVLLAMNNPLSRRPEHALFPYPPNCTGWRILEMLRTKRPGVTRAQYLRTFERLNLVDAEEWDRRAAQQRAEDPAFTSRLIGRIVVVLGEEPRRVLGLPKLLVHPVERDGTTWRQLPHPSGRCRWYNSPEHRDVAAQLLAELYDEGQR